MPQKSETSSATISAAGGFSGKLWHVSGAKLDAPEANVEVLAKDAATLTGLPTWAQRMELEEAEHDYEREPRFPQRMRLALLLTLADEELQDLDRARELLAVVPTAAPAHAQDQGLNQLLAMLVAEVQAGQARGAAGDRHGSPNSLQQDQVRRLEELLAAEREHRRVLEEQIDSLKDIDRQMNERERPRSLPLDDDDPTENSSGG